MGKLAKDDFTNVKHEQTFVIATTIALLFNVVLWEICFADGMGEHLASYGLTNVKLYLGLIVIYIVSFLIVYFLSAHMKKRFQISDRFAKIFFGLFLCLGFFLMALFFLNADNVFFPGYSYYVWHQIPFSIMATTLIALFVALYYFTNRFDTFSLESSKRETVGFWVLAAAIALMVGYAAYFPNPYTSASVEYHAHAYYNSVYNVYYNVPYSPEITSIYGHYGIFIAPILKLISFLGITNIWNAFVFSMAGLGALTYLLVCYALGIFVKNKTIRYLGVVALAFVNVALRFNMYYQRQPHRILVIAAVVAMIAFGYRHRKSIKIISWVGYLICALLTVWSTEMGIFAILSWAVFLICISAQKYKICEWRFWRDIGINILLCILSFLLAVGIVNLYNICAGGSPLTIRQFVYPFFSVDYDVGSLEVPLKAGISYWMFVLAVFLVFLGKGLSSIKKWNGNEKTVNYRNAAFTGLSIMGLTSFTYFINRAAYGNTCIIDMILILLICIFAQHFLSPMKSFFINRQKSVGNGIKSAIGLTTVFVVFSFAVATFLGAGQNLFAVPDKRDKRVLEIAAQQVASHVPANTKAMGIGAVEMYSVLGWDTQLYTMDFSDLGVAGSQTANYACELLETLEGEDFFTTQRSAERLCKASPEFWEKFMETHRLETQIDMLAEYRAAEINTSYGEVFQYYVPKEQN